STIWVIPTLMGAACTPTPQKRATTASAASQRHTSLNKENHSPDSLHSFRRIFEIYVWGRANLSFPQLSHRQPSTRHLLTPLGEHAGSPDPPADPIRQRSTHPCGPLDVADERFPRRRSGPECACGPPHKGPGNSWHTPERATRHGSVSPPPGPALPGSLDKFGSIPRSPLDPASFPPRPAA